MIHKMSEICERKKMMLPIDDAAMCAGSLMHHSMARNTNIILSSTRLCQRMLWFIVRHVRERKKFSTPKISTLNLKNV